MAVVPYKKVPIHKRLEISLSSKKSPTEKKLLHRIYVGNISTKRREQIGNI